MHPIKLHPAIPLCNSSIYKTTRFRLRHSFSQHNDDHPLLFARGIYARYEIGFLDSYSINAIGSGLKNITMDSTENYYPYWSPNGKWIAYTAGDKSN